MVFVVSRIPRAGAASWAPALIILAFALKGITLSKHPLERLLCFEAIMLSTLWLMVASVIFYPLVFFFFYFTLSVAEAGVGLSALIQIFRGKSLEFN